MDTEIRTDVLRAAMAVVVKSKALIASAKVRNAVALWLGIACVYGVGS
jgi:hypothetical protein